ncbi:aldehyde dehydrogenase family protein, partial [Pantoea sp. SIMBA_072]
MPTRLIIHEEIYERFIDALQTTIDHIPYGDPLDQSVIVGPLINATAWERVQDMIDTARASGAGRFFDHAVTAGPPGNFIPPTLIADAD